LLDILGLLVESFLLLLEQPVFGSLVIAKTLCLLLQTLHLNLQVALLLDLVAQFDDRLT
jgi:hypothetical protein